MSVEFPSQLERWSKLFPEASSELALRYFCQIQDLYRQPHRRYHTLEQHIERLLRAQEHYFPDATRPLVLALWLHDLVYDPRRPDNELKSAQLARQIGLALGLSKDEADSVYRIIMVTTDHVAIAPDESIMCDLDLLSLADPPAVYEITTSFIRLEYSFVSDPDWRQGRQKFMSRFLSRPHIYYTPTIRALHEADAQQNLKHEQIRLGHQP